MRAGLRSFLLTGAALILLAALVVQIGWVRYNNPGRLAEARTIIIPRGSGVDDIANQLWQQGVLQDPYSFQFGVRIDGSAARLRSGEYAFPAAISPREVAAQLAAGRTVIRRLTVPEGYTSAQVVGLIQAAEGLEGDIGDTPGEGELMPDTFFYSWGDSRRQMIARAKKSMNDFLAALWPNRVPGLPLHTAHEAVILASIVEKETKVADERPHVAAVFLNRLRTGMKLQADPTVIYGVTAGQSGFDRAISRADLDAPNPWNTYVIDGLPPTPIANPGKASLT